MKMLSWLAAGLMVVSAQAATVTAPGAKLEKLSGDFKFTEGPTCDAAGNVFFTDQPNDRIMKWSVDGQLSVFKQPAGRSNGMMFDRAGQLIACADENNELWSITPDGKATVLIAPVEGRYLNGPNDVWVHPGGGLYLSDPYYQRPWWKHTNAALAVRAVYHLPPGGHQLVQVADGFKQPNGITGTPDGKTLYVCDINDKKTYRFAIQADGTLADRALYCEIGSDGMTIDEEGNVYFTNKDGVTVVSPAGEKIEVIPVPEGWTANVSFGGADHKTLFVTASKGLYAIRMRVRGGNPAK